MNRNDQSRLTKRQTRQPREDKGQETGEGRRKKARQGGYKKREQKEVR